jgi:hypothetical protein
MRADFQTDDSSLNDSQSMKNNITRLWLKNIDHNFSQNLPFNEQNSNQQLQSPNHFKIQKSNDIFCSQDNREIVIANDETFGALDFQHDDINLDFDNDLSSQPLPTFSDKPSNKLLLDAEKQLSNSDVHDKYASNISPNDTLPSAQFIDKKLSELESDVEDWLHIETAPQLSQQRDNVPTVDPVPGPRYNLRNKNRQNPYTFSGKVSEKWTEAPRRNRRRTRSLDQ